MIKVIVVVILACWPLSLASAQDRLTESLRRAVVGVQMVDLAVSAYQLGQARREVNPALAWASDHPVWFATAKVGGYLLTDIMLVKLAKMNRRAAIVTSLAITGVYVGIIARNTRGIR